MHVLAVAEHTDGTLGPGSFDSIAAAHHLSDMVTAILLGESRQIAGAAETLAGAGVREVVALNHEALAHYTADGFVGALHQFISATPAEVIVFPHSYQARDYAPRLAARLGRTLLSDCIHITRSDPGIVVTRPLFRGKLNAEVALRGPGPHLISVQRRAFVDQPGARIPALVRHVPAAMDPSSIRQSVEPPFRETRQTVDLTRAQRIVAVGRGIKEQGQIDLARELASALDAELGASRPVCDAGWLAMDRQIGSSGQTVAPGLYIALGISGAVQHLVGMKGARTVVAVNTDRAAPIFEVADYGIVADAGQIVPALIKALKDVP